MVEGEREEDVETSTRGKYDDNSVVADGPWVQIRTRHEPGLSAAAAGLDEGMKV